MPKINRRVTPERKNPLQELKKMQLQNRKNRMNISQKTLIPSKIVSELGFMLEFALEQPRIGIAVSKSLLSSANNFFSSLSKEESPLTRFFSLVKKKIPEERRDKMNFYNLLLEMVFR